jgi:hypothetical protein
MALEKLVRSNLRDVFFVDLLLQYPLGRLVGVAKETRIRGFASPASPGLPLSGLLRQA